MGNLLWMINQPGLTYPAEVVRGATYAQTSGGTGVTGPGDPKVSPQPAPNGTVLVSPGSAVIRSPYTVRPESYTAANFTPQTVTVPPVGSAGSRTDLVVLRAVDPDWESHPKAAGEISPTVAPTLDYWWIEVLQGRSNTNGITYPHVVLAKITRPANTATVSAAHITDLRSLANPQTRRHVEARNLQISETQSVHTGSVVWPAGATHTVTIPEFATQVQVMATWGTIRGAAGNEARGTCQLALVHPDGSTLITQTSSWSTPTSTNDTRFTVVLGHRMNIPAKWRGRDVRVEMRATKTAGPNAYMDGGSSYVVDLQFIQEVE